MKALSCHRSARQPAAVRLSLLLFFVFGLSAQQPLAGQLDGESAPPPSIYEYDKPALPAGRIDELVFADLKQLKIEPRLCSDAVFVRRAFLDVTGSLPTADEARDFIQSKDGGKRTQLIERLLASPAFADYWSMRWADTLRIKAEFPINLWPNAARAYHRWVRTAIAQDLPYDRFVRELLTASGSNFRCAPVNFYRAMQNRTPEGIAKTVALTFMGTRIQNWPEQRQADLAVFFSQLGYKPTGEWKEEHVFWDPIGISTTAGNTAPGQASLNDYGSPTKTADSKPPATLRRKTTFPDGTPVNLPGDKDPRETFADWLLKPGNSWFARCAVNRTWYWLLGRGIVHEPDDLRDDNPPVNAELLNHLARQFCAGGYDMKQLCRLILTSSTYQLSSMARYGHPKAAAHFAAYPLRRLDAEVLIDAINKVTGTSELYTSPIPEPFSYIPKEVPAVAIGDGSITSPFLALFGRPARATGMANERSNRPLPSQALHLLNSSHIQNKIESSPTLRSLLSGGKPVARLVEDLYLTILSRYPTIDEVAAVTVQLDIPEGELSKSARYRAQRNRQLDLVWALINSTEFRYRH